LRFETIPLQLSEKQVLKLTKGSQTFIPDARQQEGSTFLYIADQIQQPGNYLLKKQDSLAAVVAFNNNRLESDLTYFEPRELKNLVPKNGTVVQAGKGSLQGTVSETNFGLQLWKVCIILALIFVAAEILLIRFYKVEKPPLSAPAAFK
jgi:hypothetical protein